jgi:TP901 family phage tail tape measure protein|tara:strand:+ start:10999 stop:14505 length:3507 start_codon:yes stop_codon:yes gene_type:complete
MAKNVNTLIKVSVIGNKELIQLRQNVELYSKNLRELKKENKDVKNINKETAQSFAENEAKLRAARSEYKKAQNELKHMNKATKNAGGFTMKMAKAFGIAQLAVDGLKKVTSVLTQQIKDSVTVFKDFDFQMQKVRAISGATDLEFEKLKDSAEALGRTTFFTATQVAQLQTNLSKLGFTSIEILDAQAAALATATAAGEDLGRTATVLGSAIRGFGLDASEAARVADVMATAFTSSALDIEKFQTSMTKVAPIAKMAGFEIEGTTALLASLTDAGIEASIAGTSLRNIFLRLADPTSDLSKRLGGSVSSVDELIPKLKEMKDSNIDLADVLGITDRRTAAAFGRILDSGESVEILTNALRNSEGAAQAMAEIVGDSLEGALLRFKSATDGLKIALVDLFGGRLQEVFDSFARGFNAIASEQSISRIAKIGRVIKNLAKLVGVYVIGVKSATLLTTLFTKALALKAAMAAKGTKALFKSTIAVNGFGAAIKRVVASTGIGLLVVGLGTLISKLAFFNSDINLAADNIKNFNDKLDEGSVAYRGQAKNSERLIEIKKELNKLTDNEGNIINDSTFNNKKYNLLKREESVLIVKLNRDMKKYTDHLLTEKSSIDDVTKATETLIKTMKQRQAVQVFEELSKGMLKSSLAVEKLKKDFVEFEFNGKKFKDEATALKFLEIALERMGKRGTSTMDDMTESFGSFFGSDVLEEREAMNNFIEGFMGDNDISLGTVKKYFHDTQEVYDEEIANLRTHIEKETGVDPATVIFGDDKKKKGKPEDGFVITSERYLKEFQQAKIKILENDKLFADERNELMLSEEQDYLEKLLELQKKHKKDSEQTEIKLAQVKAKFREADFQDQIKMLEERKALDDIELQKLADAGTSDAIMKGLQLQAELEFLRKKLDLHDQYATDYEAIYIKIKDTERELGLIQRQRFQETVGEVSNLGSEMKSLGEIMGENHILTKIGIKLSQAATLANNIEAASSKIKALANAKEALTDGAAGVAKQSKQLFPMNIAAIAATLAAVVSALSMFGIGGVGGGDSRTVTEGGQFAKGGLTKGGMFKGNSHANGGVKFAVGGRIMEAEGGEAIINKRSTSMFKPVLSAINSYNGNGVKFADGGILNSGEKFARGGQLPDIQSIVSQAQISQRVVMVESDVTKTQGKVSAIESQATF